MRSKSLPFSLLALSLTAACGTLPREAGKARLHDAQTFYATTSFAGASFSHDGKQLLVTSDKSGIFNAYALSIADGSLTQPTQSKSDATFSVSWFPADERFLYTANQGGNEQNHLYLHLASGEVHDLTPGQNLKASFVRWARDEHSFFVLTNERDPQYFDLYRYHFGAGPIEAAVAEEVAPGFQRELLFQNPGGYDLSGVSGDGAWVALTKTNDNSDSYVYLARADRPT